MAAHPLPGDEGDDLARSRRADPTRPDRHLSDAARAADAAADPIVTVDQTGGIVYANPAAHELFDTDELVGTPLASVLTFTGEHDMTTALTEARQRALAHLASPAGDTSEAEVSINPTQTETGPRWILVVHPLPRQELSIRELLRRATTDDLTPLSNRSHLLERIEATFRDPRTARLPHALVMMDLDGFKHINDTWGHDTGDAVLIEIANRLQSLCRPGDVVARLGGDEYAAWCRGVDDSHVPRLTARLADVFNTPIEVRDLVLKITGSVGATTTTFAHDPNELLRQADSAMYRAKAAGPGRRIVFDSHMAMELKERGTRQRELREALPTDQFVLHYQPVVSLADKRVIAVEALSRWNHPRLGELLPAEFLPLVESTLLGSQFDQLMIERACRQLAQWKPTLARPLSMLVNVSPSHLGPELVDRLSRLIEELDLEPSTIVIELTEEASIATPQRIAVLEGFHALGARIAVDDFGTGASHISDLAELPLDLIKLDRTLVQEISSEENRRSLASSVIDLAHALDAEVVAEGVETRADLAVLEDLGCDHAQGYMLARPRPPGDIPGVDLREVIDLR